MLKILLENFKEVENVEKNLNIISIHKHSCILFWLFYIQFIQNYYLSKFRFWFGNPQIKHKSLGNGRYMFYIFACKRINKT